MKKQSKTFRLLPEVIEKIEGYDRKRYRDETDYVSKVILNAKEEGEEKDAILEKLEEILRRLPEEKRGARYSDEFW